PRDRPRGCERRRPGARGGRRARPGLPRRGCRHVGHALVPGRPGGARCAGGCGCGRDGRARRLRPRQSVACRRARSGRGGSGGGARVIRVLIAGVIALVLSTLLGPRFIAFLRRNEFGQHIREEGPERHVVKQGTPTLGGLLILMAGSLGFLAASKYTVPALTVVFVTLDCGAIGVLDD